MATVREKRVELAMNVIIDRIRLGVFEHTVMRQRAMARVVAEDLVDALFPDHLLDNVEVPD